MNDPSLYNGEIEHHGRNLEEPTIQKFNTREEGVEYFSPALKDKLYTSSGFSGRGPTAKYINENDLYIVKYWKILEFGHVISLIIKDFHRTHF